MPWNIDIVEDEYIFMCVLQEVFVDNVLLVYGEGISVLLWMKPRSAVQNNMKRVHWK